MNTKDIIIKLREKEKLNITEKEFKDIFKDIFDMILEKVLTNEKFIIPNFGIFELKSSVEKYGAQKLDALTSLEFTSLNSEEIDNKLKNNKEYFFEKLKKNNLSKKLKKKDFIKIFDTIFNVELTQGEKFHIPKIGTFRKEGESIKFKYIPELEKSDETKEIKTEILKKQDAPSFDSHQIIYFGAPGSGKSYKIKQLLKYVNDDNKRRVTFHPEYDYASFVGSYKPITKDGDIKYEFVPQIFTNIYVDAWDNLDENYYLIIEEINRGNCAEIFGDIFQLLDRTDDGKSEYPVNPSEELKKYLESTLGENEGIASGKLILPPNLYIIATMNTSDQSLFPMDSAFKRRWDWEYIPIKYNIPESKHTIKIDNNNSFEWLAFLEKINDKIRENLNLGMDKCMGPFFIKSKKDSNIIKLEDFINKVIFYLWNDVFKDETDSIFNKIKSKENEKGKEKENRITYENFFPIESKGKENVRKILDLLKEEKDSEKNSGK